MQTVELAEFVASLTYASIPAHATAAAKCRILDQLGAQMVGSIQPWSQRIRQMMAKSGGGSGTTTVVGFGDRLGVLDAAFMNGCLGHGFEIDDTHREGGLHPGCVVVPASLAMGEHCERDGRSVIAAVVAGYEVAGRVGRAAGPSTWIDRGFHGTALFGHFGAATAGSHLHGAPPPVVVNALSITAGDCGGVTEFLLSGTSPVKRLYGGKAAYGGLRASLLAAVGIEGPASAIEGDKGVLRAFSDAPDAALMTAGLGDTWAVVDSAYKHHACCSRIQSAADAALELRQEFAVGPEQIGRIHVGGPGHGAFIGGSLRRPMTVGDAQFSTAFVVALALARGSCAYTEFSEENLGDPTIQMLCDRVELYRDVECDKIKQRHPEMQPGVVRLDLSDGRVLERRVDDYLGTPSKPLDRTRIEEKFATLASSLLPDSQIREIVDMVSNLEELPQVADLVRLAAPLGPRPGSSTTDGARLTPRDATRCP